MPHEYLLDMPRLGWEDLFSEPRVPVMVMDEMLTDIHLSDQFLDVG